MPLHDAAIIAGTVSTALFVASYLPMLVKAWRTRDLSSYSAANLAVANIGNLVHTLYVVSLPVGPIWALHGFYLFSSAVMMWWWLRYHNAEQRGPGSTRPARRTALGRRGPARACERPGDCCTNW